METILENSDLIIDFIVRHAENVANATPTSQ